MKKLIMFLVLGFFLFPLVFAGGTKLKAKIEAVDASTGTVVLKGNRYLIDNLTFWSQGLISDIFSVLKKGDVLEVQIDSTKSGGLRRLISLELEQFKQTQCSTCSSQHESNNHNNHVIEHQNYNHSSTNHDNHNNNHSVEHHSTAPDNNNHHSSHNDDTHHNDNNAHDNHSSDNHNNQNHNPSHDNHHGGGHHNSGH